MAWSWRSSINSGILASWTTSKWLRPSPARSLIRDTRSAAL
ncbi:hypothetical protein [Lysobacter gummosus]